MVALKITSGKVTSVDGKYGPARYSGVTGATVQPKTPGGLHFVGSGEASDDNQIHLQSCDVTWRGADFKDFYRAHRPQDGNSVLADCAFDNCCQPIMVGACEGAVCHRVKCTNGNDDLQSEGDDHAGDFTANHAGYWSFAEDGPDVQDFEAYDFNGCGVHLNGKDGSDGTPKSPQFGTKINNMKLVRCGSGGTHAFQPDNNQDCEVIDYMCYKPKVGPVAFWHNDMGPEYACKRWKLTYGTLWCKEAKTNVHVGEGTEDITFDQYIFVLANDSMFADADGGGDPPYTPTVTNSHVFYWDEGHVPGSVKDETSNTLHPISEADAFFTDLGDGSLVPVDPSVTAGWRPVGVRDGSTSPAPPPAAPQPVPAPPPITPSPPPNHPVDPVALQTILGNAGTHMKELWAAVSQIHNTNTRAACQHAYGKLQADWKAASNLIK